MPRFHFHLRTYVEARDEEGLEFRDLDAAKASAVTNARHLMSDDIKNRGSICLSHTIEIADPDGVRLHLTRYGDCVDVEP